MNKNLIAYGVKVATDNSAGAENGPDYFNYKDCVWDFRIINIKAILQKHGSDYSYSQSMRGSFFVIAPGNAAGAEKGLITSAVVDI